MDILLYDCLLNLKDFEDNLFNLVKNNIIPNNDNDILYFNKYLLLQTIIEVNYILFTIESEDINYVTDSIMRFIQNRLSQYIFENNQNNYKFHLINKKIIDFNTKLLNYNVNNCKVYDIFNIINVDKYLINTYDTENDISLKEYYNSFIFDINKLKNINIDDNCKEIKDEIRVLLTELENNITNIFNDNNNNIIKNISDQKNIHPNKIFLEKFFGINSYHKGFNPKIVLKKFIQILSINNINNYIHEINEIDNQDLIKNFNTNNISKPYILFNCYYKFTEPILEINNINNNKYVFNSASLNCDNNHSIYITKYNYDYFIINDFFKYNIKNNNNQYDFQNSKYGNQY